jgi:hypothetical protein
VGFADGAHLLEGGAVSLEIFVGNGDREEEEMETKASWEELM